MSTLRKPELLAPAGDLKRLKIAVLYGADAVYIGGKQFSLRSRANNFSMADIAEGTAFAKAHGARVHVTVNMLPHEGDLDGLKEYLCALQEAGVHAIIVASAAIAMYAKQIAPHLEVHISTQHSITNAAAINYWQAKGMDRVVLAREVSMAQLRETMRHTTMPLEVFIHGGMCISYSGRCMLSNHMTMRDANRGGCAQSCRWKYRLYGGDQPLHDETHHFSMSSKDLMALPYLAELMALGVASMKIEGRMKSTYYIATLVHTYRRAIDEIAETGRLSDASLQACEQELHKCESRPTANGFYAGMPRAKDQLYGVNGAGVTNEFIAYVLDYDEQNQLATVEVRNKFTTHTLAELLSPYEDNIRFMIEELYDEDGLPLTVANQPKRIVKLRTAIKMKPHAMIRKVLQEELPLVY